MYLGYLHNVKHKQEKNNILKDILRSIYFIIFFLWVSSGYQIRISSLSALKRCKRYKRQRVSLLQLSGNE